MIFLIIFRQTKKPTT